MKNFLTNNRRSGILAHISSLPSPFGIGDIGPASWNFLNYLQDCGQRCWQFLPLNPTDDLFDNSPYMSTAAFAGSPLLISPELLYQEGLITKYSMLDHPAFSPYCTEYDKVQLYKTKLLQEAFQEFRKSPPPEFTDYCTEHPWLTDYGLFMSLKKQHGQKGWFDWPKKEATRQNQCIAEQVEKLRDSILYYQFEQFIFHQQWLELQAKARERDILLFGDIPIYVGLDSVDVWANQGIFCLDKSTSLPTLVSGVPPDYFSKTGQRWGNPLYQWNTLSTTIRNNLIDWWVQRLVSTYEFVDIARIDHFRAFESYWAIPAENKDAVNGKWLKGPGPEFFSSIFQKLGPLNIIAEDLGIITEEVHKLREDFHFPGMKVLQFAFDGNLDNSFLPHNFTTPNCVVYTGTHDNDTTVGWFLSNQLDDEIRSTVKHLANREMHDHSPIHHDMIYLALSSIAALSIIPLQDVLGFGNDCRMNTPGVPKGNWGWRCAPEFLTGETATHLRQVTKRFNRI
ncbi:4-alpha-glucanotransferase [Desulfopila sp. IMCC35008]|uniref:4-alpha-glucanotransferase n=1 Tax=Desulfopila sp. IMCC35008 TaxID=2653858 RepID=UPI0013D13A47|nr:4-alpha-glucanotransferase [Desulfopila sp. IMCC35008]